MVYINIFNAFKGVSTMTRSRKLTLAKLDSETINNIKMMRVEGSRVEDICDQLGIGQSTFYKWQAAKPELKQAMDDANLMSSERVALAATSSLIERLKTRELEDVTTNEWRDADGDIIKTQTTVKKRVVEPDSALIMFALQRVLPKLWDSLAVKRVEQGADDSNDYGELIDTILNKAKSGDLK